MSSPGATDTRLLVGFLVMIAIAVSFALTVLAFGFVVLAGSVLVLAGLVSLALPRQRRPAVVALAVGAVTLSGPLIYVGLALLQAV